MRFIILFLVFLSHCIPIKMSRQYMSCICIFSWLLSINGNDGVLWKEGYFVPLEVVGMGCLFLFVYFSTTVGHCEAGVFRVPCPYYNNPIIIHLPPIFISLYN